MNPLMWMHEYLTKLLNYYNSIYVFFTGLWGGELTRYLDITSGLTSIKSSGKSWIILRSNSILNAVKGIQDNSYHPTARM